MSLSILLLFLGQAIDAHGPQVSADPGVRNAHAMVYDAARDELLLFGGADATAVRGDTWTWDGRRWFRASETGPGPRTFPAMAFDSRRGRTVLFGGNRVLFGRRPEESSFPGGTWEWDGRSWKEIEVPGPPPRAEAAVAFDSRRGRVVLFGGYRRTNGGRQRLGDTWEWDGARWIEMKVPGPSPRSGATQAYDPVRGRMVLFGGATDQGVSGETWEWDGMKWLENRAASAEPRFNSVAVWDGTRREIVRFGGRNAGKPMGDTWAYDGKRWKRVGSSGPSARNHTAMSWDSKRRRVVLFGGHDFGASVAETNVLGDLWIWNGRVWILQEARPSIPRAENGH